MLKFYLIFLKKKNLHGNENFNRKPFLLKYSIDLGKINRNRVTILIKEHFSPKFIFRKNFLFEKRGKILTKQFFSNKSVQVGKGLLMSIGRWYLLAS